MVSIRWKFCVFLVASFSSKAFQVDGEVFSLLPNKLLPVVVFLEVQPWCHLDLASMLLSVVKVACFMHQRVSISASEDTICLANVPSAYPHASYEQQQRRERHRGLNSGGTWPFLIGRGGGQAGLSNNRSVNCILFIYIYVYILHQRHPPRGKAKCPTNFNSPPLYSRLIFSFLFLRSTMM